jgi:hypothetical protein
MSFFGRAANLIKGGIKSVGRSDRDDDAAARARALEAELARDTAPVAPHRAAGTAKPAPPTPPAPDRGPPERDANGDVKRTL